MQSKSPKSLEHILNACSYIVEWTANRSLADYESDAMMRAAVERAFEIIGEALLRLERNDPLTAARISDYRRIIGFRNRLAHGYDVIDNGLVWEYIQSFVPVLHADVAALLEEVDE